jgi:SAM-dependent methyltransferase
MAHFELEQFDPCPLTQKGIMDGCAETTHLLALDIQSKYLFVDDTGKTYHEYFVPGTPDVQNCGGYVDKVIKYRDPLLYQYLSSRGVSNESFAASQFPILQTRSPKLDLLLFDCIRHLQEVCGVKRVSLLDHGCTVAEHYDLLDVMLRAASGGKLNAVDCLAYCGLDKSAMLITIGRLLHPTVPEADFRLMKVEGSAFQFRDQEFDLSLSVGVINHVANPVGALASLLSATRYACVLAIWVTFEGEGFWAFNHSGVPNYFFSQKDLAQLLKLRGAGRFFSVGFTSEDQASQMRSYVGIGEDKLRALGSYHLVFSTLPELPFKAEELAL